MAFKNAKIIICLGTGGVGKTTVAATLGFLAAKEGLKTLVMTVDPSRRLAQTLGIGKKIGITKVKFDDGISMDATVVDHKKVFDDFLKGVSENNSLTEKLFKNKLYQELSTTLSGSQEFTCLEVLYQNAKSGKYDLIVLDTPPAHHAIEFLRAPQKLAQLFQQETIQWFIQTKSGDTTFMKKLFQTGTQKVLSLLEGITGSEFIGSLKEFFISLGPWSQKIIERTNSFHEMLVLPSTHFYLVSAPDVVSLVEAQDLAREIYQGGYNLKTVIFNRTRAPWTKHPNLESKTKIADDEVESDLSEQFKIFKEYFFRREKDAKEFISNLPGEIPGMLLPEFDRDIANTETLQEFSKVFKNEKFD